MIAAKATCSGILLALACSAALAQEARGTILGRISDPSGAPVPGAKVQAVNLATNTAVGSLTNPQGNYEIPYLLPGIYRVEVEAPGFKKAVRDRIELRVSDRLSVDFALQVGEVIESVLVTAETPLLETTGASVGTLMDQRRISELPIVGGNPIYLVRLAPGIVSTAGRGNGHDPYNQGAGTTLIAVNGTRTGSSEVSMDGAPNMSERNNFYAPPQDLVEEFKIQTASYDAAIGHATGAVTNISTKSGTNQLHGTAYLFQQRFEAIPWFSNRWLHDPATGPITEEKLRKVKLPYAHERAGVTLSGPLIIPHLYDGRQRSFFSVGYERAFQSRNTTFTGTVPTAEQLRGDFSSLLKLGAQYQIYDPATIAPAAGGRFSRQPFPGNLIPPSRISPIAQKLAAYWPKPTAPGTVDGRDNYFRNRETPRLWRTPIARVDHNLSEKHRLFVRGNYFHFKRWFDPNLDTVASGNLQPRRGYGFVVDDVYVFSPQVLLNIRGSINYNDDRTIPRSRGFDLLSLGFPQSLLSEIQTKNDPAGIAFPQITVDGLTGLGETGGSITTTNYQTYTGTLTRILAGHSLRVGAEYRLMRENGYNFGNVAPRIDFGTTWTRGPLDNSPAAPIGQGLASMLLGLPTGGRIDINGSRAEQSTYTAFFFQNDWRITSRLTLHIGLRYEYEGPTTERYNRSIRSFDFNSPNPIGELALANYSRAPIPEVPVSAFRILGGLTFAGAHGQPRRLWNADKNNFAPRVGLAFQLSRKIVIRAGYGVFYDVLGIDRQDVNQGGFNQTTNLIPSLDNGLTFRATLANPFPDGLQVPLGAAAGLRTYLGRGISFFNERPLNPYMQRWSFSIQREFPGRILAEAAYLGNRGTKLGASQQFNPVPRQYLSTLPVRDQPVIDFLSSQVRNPFYGIPEFSGTGLAGVNVARSQLLRPYPHFGDVSASLPNGYSWYHSLQIAVEKRLQKGLTFHSGYTWSKFMEATSYLNETDPVPEKVISDQDYPHRFVVTAIYELPFGRGKPFFGGARGLLNLLIGGWQVEGWYEGQSGRALGFGNAIFYGDLHAIPLPVSQRRVERWFNVDAGFERDPRKQLAYNVRTLSSRFNGVRADGINNLDLSLHKNIALREGWRLQFRAECSNALNHPQFDSPNTTPTSTAFGTVSAELGHGQRKAVLALKFLF